MGIVEIIDIVTASGHGRTSEIENRLRNRFHIRKSTRSSIEKKSENGQNLTENFSSRSVGLFLLRSTE